jgi:hypothetical protein
LPVPILVENEHLQIWQLLTALLAFLEVKHSHLHIVSILNIKAEKTPQHFNASLFVTIWVAVIGSFLIIDARMGRVMKRGVLQNTGPCLQAHYSFLGLARGIPPVKFMTSYETQEYKGFSQPHSQLFLNPDLEERWKCQGTGLGVQ